MSNFLKELKKSYCDSSFVNVNRLSLCIFSDKPVPTNRGGNEPGMRAECKTEQKLVDDVKRSSHSKFASNAESTVVRDSGIESSKTPENVPCRRRKPFHGLIGSNGDGDGGGLVYFALPPLHKQIELLTRCAPRSVRSRRRKSRWDEKPDGIE